MGRSRAVPQSADDDHGQSRSKRKRSASNVENLGASNAGQGLSEGEKALYHCNYCNKDISGKVRIKCAICSDFDLCVECFSVGAEVNPHKSNHSYRVMDNLSFPLICSDWNADEEILLLEGIEMYGLGNWTEVAEHVGTKDNSQCVGHYNTIYMDSSYFPLPDMSHVSGKNREELLAMARGPGDVKKGFSTLGEVAAKDESSFTGRIKVDDQRKDGSSGRSTSGLTSGSSNGNLSSGVKKATGMAQGKNVNDAVKLEDSHAAERSVGAKKLRTSGDEGPSITEFSGYNPKRLEFEIEYDNDAEQLLTDMEFKDADTDAERELKLRVLHIYSRRLDERKRRKDFILERNLLLPDPFEQDLSLEERELCQRYRAFMRFLSKEEHLELLRSLIDRHRILKRIQDLQEARAAGCRTSAQADNYIEKKRKREAEENARKAKEGSQACPGGKFLQRANHLKGDSDSSPRGVKDSSSITAGLATSYSLDYWDVNGFEKADMLSEAEKRLCGEIKILPTHYLSMLQTMSIEIYNGKVTKKSDAHSLFKVDANKVDKVYDMLVKKGIAHS